MPATSVKQRKILLVEDEESIAFPLSKLLERRGFSVNWQSTGSGGLSVFESDETIDLVLLDIMLPDMSGWNVLDMMEKYMKSVDPRPSTSFIVLSADSRAAKKAHEETISFVPKPINFEDLMKRIEALQ